MSKIVLVIILIAAIFGGVYLATNRTSFFGQANESALPEGIVVSNIEPSSLTISYFTAQPSRTLVNYGEGSITSSSATDDRDGAGAGERKTHTATLKDLKPDTEYSVKIDNQDQIYSVKTAPGTINSSISKNYKGTVLGPEKNPVKEGVVFFRLEGGQMLSAPLDAGGGFQFNLSDYRNADLASSFAFNPATGTEFYVQAGEDGIGYYKTLSGTNRSIDILIERTFIPFFRIQQGPLIRN